MFELAGDVAGDADELFVAPLRRLLSSWPGADYDGRKVKLQIQYLYHKLTFWLFGFVYFAHGQGVL
jgi:hypothetical protein